MTTRAEFIAEARTWIGTRYLEQDRTKGKGVGCMTFVEVVAEESGATNGARVRMRTLLRDYFEPVASLEDAKSGDVIFFCDETRKRPHEPRHMGLLTEFRRPGVPYVLHADTRGVVEHRIDQVYALRIHSLWRLRTLSD